MTTIVVPHRGPGGKQRLSLGGLHDAVVEAMLADVLAACDPIGATIVADGDGGQGAAVAAALTGLAGPVLVVNSDLPCATPADVRALLNAIPAAGMALVAARDGTTNALGLSDAALFQPLYGLGSAERFRALAPARDVELPNLVDDVDTLDDLRRLGPRLGPHTQATLSLAA